jgi:hypothetical protein
MLQLRHVYRRADNSRPVCPSLSAHESESMLRTCLQREASKRHVGEAHSVQITVILLLQRLSCY